MKRREELRLQPMEKHEGVRTGPEERLQRAAGILAMGAIRAALRQQASLVGTETTGETGRKQEPGVARDPQQRRSADEESRRTPPIWGTRRSAVKGATRRS